MNLKHSLLIVSFVSIVLVFRGTVSATPIKTISYKEAGDCEQSYLFNSGCVEYSWLFKWDATPTKSFMTFFPRDPSDPTTPVQKKWHSSVSFNDSLAPGVLRDAIFDDLEIAGFHHEGPHLRDVDPGHPFKFEVPEARSLAIAIFPKRIGVPEVSEHIHDPLHFDSYLLAYTRDTKEGPVTFKLTGVHRVPEPSTLLLFGVGALGIVGYCRRRWKRKSGSNSIFPC